MATWKAFILTQSNRLEVVEFDTPNIVRDDAIAQCMSMYGAKEVKSCNIISKSTSNESNSSSTSSASYSSSGDGDYWDFMGGLVVIAGVFALVLVVHLWPLFLAGGILYLIYKFATKDN